MRKHATTRRRLLQRCRATLPVVCVLGILLYYLLILHELTSTAAVGGVDSLRSPPAANKSLHRGVVRDSDPPTTSSSPLGAAPIVVVAHAPHDGSIDDAPQESDDSAIHRGGIAVAEDTPVGWTITWLGGGSSSGAGRTIGPAPFRPSDFPPTRGNEDSSVAAFTFHIWTSAGDDSSAELVGPLLDEASLVEAVRRSSVLVFECIQTKTFLSRQRDGGSNRFIVTADALRPRSSERWKLRFHTTTSSSMMKKAAAAADRPLSLLLFSLYGVRSAFVPDADDSCVGVENSKVARENLLIVDTRQLGSSSCGAVSISPRTPERRHKLDRGPLRANMKADTSFLCVAFVSTIKPLARFAPRERLLQLNLLRQWVIVMDALGHDREQAPSLRTSFVLCIEDADDVRTLTEWLHNTSVHPPPRVRVAIFTDCEFHPRLNRTTYRGLFAKAEDVLDEMKQSLSGGGKISVLSFTLMVNADVLIDRAAVDAMLSCAGGLLHSSVGGRHRSSVVITGGRWNCAPSAWNMPPMSDEAGGRLRHAGGEGVPNCVLFQDDAEDYFLVSKGALRWRPAAAGGDDDDQLSWDGKRFAILQEKWSKTTEAHHRGLLVPPMVVGGTAFDNWLVSAAANSDACVVVDATPSVYARHYSYFETKASHRTAASRFNSEVAHYSGGWANGKLSSQQLVLLPWLTGAHEDGGAFLHLRGAVAGCHRHIDARSVGVPLHDNDVGECGAFVQRRRPRGDAFDRPWMG